MADRHSDILEQLRDWRLRVYEGIERVGGLDGCIDYYNRLGEARDGLVEVAGRFEHRLAGDHGPGQGTDRLGAGAGHAEAGDGADGGAGEGGRRGEEARRRVVRGAGATQLAAEARDKAGDELVRYRFKQGLIAVMDLARAGECLQGRVAAVERVLLAATVLLVLIVELLNTAVEYTVDRIGTDHHELSGRAKDMVIVGGFNVFPRIIEEHIVGGKPVEELMVERVVEDVDEIVRLVRFDGWQSTSAGEEPLALNSPPPS